MKALLRLPVGRPHHGLPAVRSLAGLCLRSLSTVDRAKGRVLVVAGPTGVGKTDISVRLAERLGGEIVSADSVQVYRGCDIGSDKVSASIRQQTPHHLIDVLDLTEPFSAGAFCRMARDAVDDILSRGKVPIVVGGSMFYMRMFVRGTPGTPPSTPEARADVERMFEEDGSWEKSVQRLAQSDPTLASQINERHPNDWYRLGRALQIVYLSGKPPSAFGMKEGHGDYDFRCVFLSAPRLELFRHIDERCEHLVHRGLLQEFIGLHQQGLSHKDVLGRFIGYKEAADYIEDEWLGKETYTRQRRQRKFQLFLEKYMQATRLFAKQQWMWYRKESYFHWVDATRPDLDERVLAYAQTSAEERDRLLAQPNHISEAHCKFSKAAEKELRRYTPQFNIFDKDEEMERLFKSVEKCLLETGLLTAPPKIDEEAEKKDWEKRKMNRVPVRYRKQAD